MLLNLTIKKSLFIGITLLVINGMSSCGKKSTTPSTGPNPNPNPVPFWDPNAMRGVWVTTTASTALDNRNNIKQMFGNCKSAGINNVFIVVYNNGRTIFPSTVMQNLNGIRQLERFAGRDPLQECIEEGKIVGIKVHAWFEYGFAASFSANGGSIVAAKPDWAAKDINGRLVVKNGFDWLNGLHPEVQQFMIDLFKEVISKYEVDGVQGDDRLPAMPPTGGYDPYTVNLYKSENGGADPPPASNDAGWLRWRANKLTLFL